MSNKVMSWGRYPRFPQKPQFIVWPEDVEKKLAQAFKQESHDSSQFSKGVLAYGMGRSYGDSCLAASDQVLVTSAMNRILSIDWANGVVEAQAGLTLDDLISVVLPRGWFPTVTPGTRFVTLGGAVANDVHGKNHHVAGTFGAHVRRLRLFRSGEGVVLCSPKDRPELFAATIGGLGLTGIIFSVELQLRPVSSSEIAQRSVRFGSLDEFFDVAQAFDEQHEYTVAWVDCVASGQQRGRGIYMAGDHASDGPLEVSKNSRLGMPVELPFSAVNSFSLRWFNRLYYGRHPDHEVTEKIPYSPFFYPLDAILNWNRMYGQKGFQQYQCSLPEGEARQVMDAMLQEVSASGMGSFLAVLKRFGDIASPGLLSFPQPGFTLALDFPQKDEALERLFARLDSLVHEAGGRLYPAKDAHMSAVHFQQAYPKWQELENHRDPCILSRFWQRVTQ